ncbi:MAG TPA: folylpolyglutamate synthase/dihydrofolate synthase family protein [Candidatus Nanoarchaeia archaeon]|nr:folylpolyglutamate synthase/dihydrofolate synthase family protein [Candidatus Nanoarchaeia archaeon]
MDYEQVVDEIFSIRGSEHVGSFKLGLKKINDLLEKLGNPQKTLRCIHVAGTNGKGSVCAMISQILIEAGYKTGMYTSPHLKDFRERYQINNRMMTKQEAITYYQKVKPHITNQSFFEVITAMAFLYFKEKKIDYLVCEVGLGGRLDATNVITPLLSIITNIGLEHKDYLGGTIEKIAFEKAGIIKENIPVVTGAKGSALKVIRKMAIERHARLFTYGKPDIKYPLNLKGEFQKINSGVVIKAVNVLNDKYNLKISNAQIKKGLARAMIPGRLQFISKNTLIDCAHNPPAVKTLCKELVKLKKSHDKIILIMGVLKDKDYRLMLDGLAKLSDRIVIVKPKIPRALDPRVIAKGLEKNFIIIEDTKKALVYAKKIAGPKDLIVVTGSFYVVGEVV